MVIAPARERWLLQSWIDDGDSGPALTIAEKHIGLPVPIARHQVRGIRAEDHPSAVVAHRLVAGVRRNCEWALDPCLLTRRVHAHALGRSIQSVADENVA